MSRTVRLLFLGTIFLALYPADTRGINMHFVDGTANFVPATCSCEVVNRLMRNIGNPIGISKSDLPLNVFYICPSQSCARAV
jgi:hypothetical protein